MNSALRACRVARVSLLLVAVTTLTSCTEAVATVQSGRVRVPLDSTITVTVLPDRATTFDFPAAPGTGVYFDVSATGGAARVTAGDATLGVLQATVGVDPVRGPLRTATIPAGVAGGVQVAVLPPLAGVGVASGAAQVTIRAHSDSSFDATFKGGRVLAGVRYGTARPGCAGFGYVDLAAPVTATIMGRSNRGQSFGAKLNYNVAGSVGLGDFTLWRPVAGVDSLDLAQGAAVVTVLTSGRWGFAACDSIGEARFQLAYTHATPEVLPSTGIFGDTIVGESIDVPGDTDTFTVPLPAGTDSFFVALSGGDRQTSRLVLTFVDPCCFVGATSRGANTTLLSNTTGMLAGASIGRTQVVFSIAGAGAISTVNRGPYRFAVLRAPSLNPEFVASARAVGDTIRGETLWTSVDVDQFTLSVPASTSFTAQLRKLDDVGLPSQLAVSRIDQFGSLFGSPAVVDTAASATVRLPMGPVSGTVYLRVDSPDRSFVGRYELVILPGIVP